jgi:hypothetical protein
MTIDSGSHTIVMKSSVIPSMYTTTHYFPSGEEFTFNFNCADDHLTFNADAAWIAAGASKLMIYNPAGLGTTYAQLVPGAQAAGPVNVPAGSILLSEIRMANFSRRSP